jgi:hypothetical protein
VVKTMSSDGAYGYWRLEDRLLSQTFTPPTSTASIMAIMGQLGFSISALVG